MSKRILRFLGLLAVATLLTATLNSFYGVRAQRARELKKDMENRATRNASIVEATDAVLKETSEIRELAILRPVKSGAESRADIERMLIRNLDKQTTPAEMHATELSLRKFGLVPANFQYRPFIIKLLTEQVAGYYDTRAQQFHLADWLDLEGQKPVMAHELTHALQDQHFNLRRFEKWPDGDGDAELAAHALIEGDATLAMTFYMVKNPMLALAFRKSLGAGGISTEQYDQAPRAIRETLIFPYLKGAEWATQVYKRGGWKAITKAYTTLPLSSEQILHPEKYFSYELPVKITLPDLTGLLNGSKQQKVNSTQQLANRGQQRRPSGRQVGKRRRPPPKPPIPTAWRLIDSDVNGEWSYYLLLDQFLSSITESKRAAAGWGGDRYDVYEGPKGQVFLAQLTAWDTENDAHEFYDAYVKRTKERYKDGKPVGVSGAESTRSEAQNLSVWATSEGVAVVQLRGSRVVVLEGIPQGVDYHALLKALGQ